MKGSIVIPVYNEEVFIENFFKKIKQKITSSEDLEFVFVDDGSTDYSARILKRIADKFGNIKIVTLDKNYGKQVAIAAGMKYATGEFVVVTPISPYNPHIAINQVIDKWQEGYKIVRAIRDENAKKHKENKISSYFMGLMKKLFKIPNDFLQKATVELYDREVVDVLNALPEKNMVLRNVNSWLDYEIYEFVYNPGTVEKTVGKKYTQAEEGYNKLRKQEKLKKQKVAKKRLYAPSLYASLSMLMLFALSAFLIAIFKIYVETPFVFNLFMWLLLLTSLVLCVLFGCRAWMIKKIGILPVLSNGDDLYTVKDIYVSK